MPTHATSNHMQTKLAKARPTMSCILLVINLLRSASLAQLQVDVRRQSIPPVNIYAPVHSPLSWVIKELLLPPEPSLSPTCWKWINYWKSLWIQILSQYVTPTMTSKTFTVIRVRSTFASSAASSTIVTTSVIVPNDCLQDTSSRLKHASNQ